MKKLHFNIQLFADLKTAGKTSTYAGIANVDQAHEFVERGLKESIYDEYDLKDYAEAITLPRNNGETMTLRKLSKYDAAINELEEGVTPSEDAPMSIYEYKVGVKQYGGYTTFTDKIDIFSLNNGWAARIARNQGNSVGEKFQAKVRDAFWSSPNKWFAGVSTITSGQTLAQVRANVTAFQLDDLRKIKAAFKRMKVKPYANGDYVMLVSPEVEQSLFTLKKSGANEAYTFVEISKYTDTKPLFEGEFGRWSNFRLVTKDCIDKIATKADGTEIHGCIALGRYNNEKGLKLVELEGKGAPETIIKPCTEGGAKENPLNMVGSVGWKIQGWGAKVLYAEAVMIYECTADTAIASVFPETSREAYVTGTNGQYQTSGGHIANGAAVQSTASTTGTIKNGKATTPYAE